MKSTATYLVVSTVSFVLLFQIAVLIFIVKPEIFGFSADVPLADQTGIQNTENTEHLNGDTLAIENEKMAIQTVISQKDSTIHVLEDSIRNLSSLLEDESEKAAALRVDIRNLNVKLENKKVEADQNFAKIIESMDAEDAVRVLSTLDDGKVRSVLLTVNRRQAARIMSNIEPDRAARIMSYSTDGSD